MVIPSLWNASLCDGTTRVAIVETRTQGSRCSKILDPLFRYQISNRLGSVSIELDETGEVIRIHTLRSHIIPRGQQPAKKNRYAGKERDTQTGFYYNDARYYLPWLARWASAYPAGLVDGPNVFTHTNNNPIGEVTRQGLMGNMSK
jgi:RHS repeat-associated protein